MFTWPVLGKAAVGAVLAGLLTALLFTVHELIEPRHAVLTYVALVYLCAFALGPAGAASSAAVSVAFLDYLFVPPEHGFGLRSPLDSLMLAGFLAVSGLSAYVAHILTVRRLQMLAFNDRLNAAASVASMLLEHGASLDCGGPPMEAVRSATGASQVVAIAYDGESDTFALPVGCPLEDQRLLAAARHVVNTGEGYGDPVLGSIRQGYPAWWPTFSAGIDDARDMAVPMRASSGMQGVLYFGERTDRRLYTQDEVWVALAAARLVASSIERGRLEADAARNAAESSAQRLKSVFMSSVSHELKSPLAAIDTIVSNWQDQGAVVDAELATRDLPILARAVDRLERSIDDLLQLARFHGDAWESRMTECEVGDVVAHALEGLDDTARDRVELLVPEEPILFVCDLDQLSRALRELTSNALAYTGPGRVIVGGECDGDQIRIWVQDEGPALSTGQLMSVFEPYHRGDGGRPGSHGSGLGLAIAREVVRYHGGDIVAKAQGAGSRFTIEIPVRKQAGDAVH